MLVQLTQPGVYKAVVLRALTLKCALEPLEDNLGTAGIQ